MVNGASTAWSGEDITVAWDVANLGDSPTPTNYWQDSVYLSDDETLDPADLRLCTFGHTGALIADGAYSSTQSCTLLRWQSGVFYVFVAADSANHVPEHGFEDNNHGYDAVPLTINLTPRKCLAYRSPVEAFLSELGRDVEIRFA